VPQGGHPAQTELLTGRAVFTDAYAVIPSGVQRDIVVSYLPHWDGTRVWVLARPLSGFAETFSHYLIEVAPGGGSELPEPDGDAEGALFVVGGELILGVAETEHVLRPGGFAYLPPGCAWNVRNRSSNPVQFHWIRKLYQRVLGIALPDVIVADEKSIAPTPMPGTEAAHGSPSFETGGEFGEQVACEYAGLDEMRERRADSHRARLIRAISAGRRRQRPAHPGQYRHQRYFRTNDG